MTTRVWADIGGTFTDCFVCQDDSRSEIKVLSSGRVRATVRAIKPNHEITVDTLPERNTDSFWVGADATLLDRNGQTFELGRVTSHQGGDLGFQPNSPDLHHRRWLGSTLELCAGLEAPVLATHLLLHVPILEPLPPVDVRLGTTRGTNALLTRTGAPTALLVTKGFRDLLHIGEQDRPDLFSINIQKNPVLASKIIEVDERLDSTGKVLRNIDPEQIKIDLQAARSQGAQSLAICLLHSHLNDSHENLIDRLARECGFDEISRSSEVAPLIKYVARSETTTLDAYLNPILSTYLDQVWNQFGGEANCKLRLMTSSGNLVEPSSFRGRDSILSGPAGGVVALADLAKKTNQKKVIGLDMGGTSTDVSRYEGQVGRRYESRVAGIRVLTPMMDIETVAAGGGSICSVTASGRLTVGPESAGAEPGPACYGKGGPLTVTDVNLLLGRIPIDRFPFPLDKSAAEKRLWEAQTKLGFQHEKSIESLAEGFLEIAVTHMAEAVRTVSTSQGSDVRSMALAGFGGAAGQHLCRIADALGIKTIIDHPASGMLSALGMGIAEMGVVVTQGLYQEWDGQSELMLTEEVDALKRKASEQLNSEHRDDGIRREHFEIDIRYQGTEAALTLPLEPKGSILNRFQQTHRNTFGYVRHDRHLELVALRCETTIQEKRAFQQPLETSRDSNSAKSKTTQSGECFTKIWHRAGWTQAKLIDRESLVCDQKIDSPSVIVDPHSTLVVEPGWQAVVLGEGVIMLSPNHSPALKPSADFTSTKSDRKESKSTEIDSSTARDPVLLEVIARRLQGIADAMGEVLRRTSISVNVKERRDYSCAIFRKDGSLVANAPHVPVHLGAMGHTVRHILGVYPQMHSGDCYLSNDPFAGGSHLPDVTAVTPVFCGNRKQGVPDFFVASRAHHAEIGGITPGSMPPHATCLAEEGVLIRDFPLVRNEQSLEKELLKLLTSGSYPSRSPHENLADIAAQQAAGQFGARSLLALARDYSRETIDAMMCQLLDVSGDTVQRWIESLPAMPMHFSDSLDDGTTIAVTMTKRNHRLEIKFETGPVHQFGFNATPAIVTAAVLYVFRCLGGSELPLCEGALRDVDLIIPRGLLDPPRHPDPRQCAAVVAGNVETSQRVVDVLLGALGVAAASQGTMNNVLIGDDSFGYYETIAGGSGATPSQPGADAVHCHMTNTRITDPEILETRLPVRLHQFSIRTGSGGRGQHQGGDGVTREFEFLKPLVVSLITSRRKSQPYGIANGDPGQSGENWLIRQGIPERLDFTTTLQVDPGDRLLLHSPGGGGWGEFNS